MRRLLLIVVLVLLPTAALAECAWVLWMEQAYRTFKADEWTPIAAYPTYPECQKQVRAKIAGWLKEGATALTGNVVKFQKGDTLLTARVLCLPDTIDPRGPVTK